MGQHKVLVLTITAIAAVFLLSLACLNFYLKNTHLNDELSQTKEVLNKTHGEVSRMREDKDKVLKENEKLQADTVTYLGLNSKMQQEKEKFQQAAEESKKAVEKIEDELQKAKLALSLLGKRVGKEEMELKGKLKKDKDDLQKNVKELEETLASERGFYHYNLAVAFTQAKLYDEAIDAYKKSLEYNPANPEAHYNLGLLLANVKGQTEEAVEHYRKYLQLKPDAEDKEEVEAWIVKLK
ncbi:MAG: tetratricopeptide repeat protein [Candidatus Omnitrophica bacterium]|nr:tetratricopeptide repeat protein [Candidatus Omnitrophota bacterium]